MNKDTFATNVSCIIFQNTFKGLFMVVWLAHSYHLGLLDLHCIEPVPFKDKVLSILLDHIGRTSHIQLALAMKNEF